MKDFRVEVKVKNARLYNLIMRDYDSVSAFSRDLGFNQVDIGKLINFRLKPLHDSGSGWTNLASKIAAHFGMLEEDIWPESMAELKLKINTSSFELYQEELAELSQKTDSFKQISDGAALKALDDAVHSLAARESKVLKMRFGLNGEEEMTLEEVANHLGVTRERIRQIESKALRKLRHPTRSNTFSDYLFEPKDLAEI